MIRLTRSIKVVSFDVQATVAVGRQRPEFLAVARLAADLDRPIGARDVLRELLGERPEVLGWRVIERSLALGLLERRDTRGPAVLSNAGRLALRYGEVLVPEEGIWRFYLVDDPLVPAALIHAERLETEPSKKGRKAIKDARQRGEQPPKPDRPPELLRRCKGEAPCPSLVSGNLLQLVELTNGGKLQPSTELRLTLTWDSTPTIRVTGRLPTSKHAANLDKPVDAPPVLEPYSYDVVWAALVSHATGLEVENLNAWRSTAGRPVCPTRFQDLASAARQAFAHQLEVSATEWRELGCFDATKLERVSLVPATESDAQAWLEWLQWQAIRDYAVPDQLERQGQQLVTDHFPYHRPRPLSSAALLELAKRTRSRDDAAWHLLAPHDLGLWS